MRLERGGHSAHGSVTALKPKLQQIDEGRLDSETRRKEQPREPNADHILPPYDYLRKNKLGEDAWRSSLYLALCRFGWLVRHSRLLCAAAISLRVCAS